MGAIDLPASAPDPAEAVGAPPPLRLLIPYVKERDEDKDVDALALKRFLERAGHEVLAVDAALARIDRTGAGAVLEAGGQRHPFRRVQRGNPSRGRAEGAGMGLPA